MMGAQKSSPTDWRCHQVHSNVDWLILKLTTTLLDSAASLIMCMGVPLYRC